MDMQVSRHGAWSGNKRRPNENRVDEYLEQIIPNIKKVVALSKSSTPRNFLLHLQKLFANKDDYISAENRSMTLQRQLST